MIGRNIGVRLLMDGDGTTFCLCRIYYCTVLQYYYYCIVSWRERGLLEASCPYAVYKLRLLTLGLLYAPYCWAAGLAKHFVSPHRIVWYAPCWPFSIYFNIIWHSMLMEWAAPHTYQLDFACYSDKKDATRTRRNKPWAVGAASLTEGEEMRVAIFQR